MEAQVVRCENCPCWSSDIDGSEYCSVHGSPDSRYDYDKWDDDKKQPPIPEDCPLKNDGVVTIRLAQGIE